MRLLEDGANRSLETAPAPAASPRLPIERPWQVGARSRWREGLGLS
jgi:hypothetical protein